VVDNRPGASGTVAATAVANSPADGYTVLFCDNSTWSINPHLYAQLQYDPFKDFAPITQVAVLPIFLVTVGSLPVTSLAELIAYAKRNPGALHYASAGNGSIHHITTEMLKSMAGIDIVHVPFKGGAQFIPALLAGDVQVAFSGYTSISPNLANGKLRLLAISSARRAPGLPQVPTVAEAGVPGFDMASSIGALAPAGTPPEIVAKLHSGISAALSSPEVTARVTAIGGFIQNSTPEQFAAIIRDEYTRFGKAVKISGARID
jgi:tripartite-type tricarboxylate transporter receptor subunit TctC